MKLMFELNADGKWRTISRREAEALIKASLETLQNGGVLLEPRDLICAARRRLRRGYPCAQLNIRRPGGRAGECWLIVITERGASAPGKAAR